MNILYVFCKPHNCIDPRKITNIISSEEFICSISGQKIYDVDRVIILIYLNFLLHHCEKIIESVSFLYHFIFVSASLRQTECFFTFCGQLASQSIYFLFRIACYLYLLFLSYSLCSMPLWLSGILPTIIQLCYMVVKHDLLH